ncbi:MAG: hypothetical protein Q8J78_13525 [Moraxellaceae bacterium]|nr:hypothetical protein [Moraxellaceae bacterium]
MKTRPVPLLAILLLSGCTTAGVYESMRQSRLNACRQLPDAQQQHCLETVSGDYEEYRRQREEAAGKP